LANLNPLTDFYSFYIILIVKKNSTCDDATITKFITSPDSCAYLTWKNQILHFCRVPKTYQCTCDCNCHIL